MPRDAVAVGEPGASLVPIIWFETIRRWEQRYGQPPSSLFFHKITTLTRFRLEQRRVPVPLPYAWYLFGTAAQDLPHEVQIYDEPESEETAVRWVGSPPETFEGDRSADAIRSAIDSLLNDYPPTEGERAVDEVYAHAPFEFQRRYRRVRIAFGFTGRGSAEVATINTAGGPWGLLLDALDVFPYDRFAALAPHVGVVRETVNVALNAPTLEQRRGLAGEVVESFWSTFCSLLRLDPEGHKDVSSQRLPHWRRVAEQSARHFERILGDVVVELSQWEGTVARDATLGPILDRRRSEQVEEARLVEEGLEVLPPGILSDQGGALGG